MPLDYQLASSLVRVKKATSPGVFSDDADVAAVGVALPDPLVSDDPELTFAWRMPGRSGSKVKLKVTFRAADGTEVAGTFTAYAFVVVSLHKAEQDLGGTRPAIERQAPGPVAGTSAVPMALDELGVNDVFGLRLSGIVAAGATRLFIRCEEVD